MVQGAVELGDALCPGCHTLFKLESSQFAAYFRGHDATCPMCGCGFDLWQTLIQYVRDADVFGTALRLAGARTVIARVPIGHGELKEVDVAPFGVPTDAEIIALELQPEGGGNAAVFHSPREALPDRIRGSRFFLFAQPLVSLVRGGGSEITRVAPSPRSIRLERRDRSRPIDLGAMGQAVRKFHTLWLKCGIASTTERTAAELTDLVRRAQLMPVAAFPGSFGIQIETADPALFDVIAKRVTHLVAKSTDHEALTQFFSEYPGVRDPYNSFLKTLHDEGLDMQASWSAAGEPNKFDGVFIGADRAELARAAIRKTSTSKELAFTATGYCRGVLEVGRKFEFFDTAAKILYIGRVSKALALRLQNEAVVLSEGQIYDASISERTAASPDDDVVTEYELVELKALAGG